MEYIDICGNEKMIKTAVDAVVNYYNKTNFCLTRIFL